MQPEAKKKALPEVAASKQGKANCGDKGQSSRAVKFGLYRLSTFPPVHAVKVLGKWRYFLLQPL